MNVVLGVGGGIAAYKAPELARALMERDFRVQVVMTAAAQEFVQPLTFAALTGRKVITGMFSRESQEETLSSAVEHIAVAQDNQILVVAPVTADLLAKFAHGEASDFLTTLYLAFSGAVVLAPAMNTNMWLHPATRANVEILRGRGHTLIDPEEGWLACGMTGPGRLPEPERIAQIVAFLEPQRKELSGETVLITAGPTQEPLDAVRFLSNRSSGKMGYALAEAAVQRGARVILISGPVSVAPVRGAEMVRVRTAAEMREAVVNRLAEATIVIKAAAVADYRPAQPARGKLKKQHQSLTVNLEPVPDILAEIGRLKRGQLVVGFAAETDDLLSEATRKLESKNCDMIVANRVGDSGTGFESDDNEVVLVFRNGESLPIPRAPKPEVARRILDHLGKLRRTRGAAE